MSIPIYDLQGPQVEPESGFWLRCPVPRTVSLQEVRDVLDAHVQPFSYFSEKDEFKELQRLYAERFNRPQGLSRFLTDELFFERVPAGAILSFSATGGDANPITNGVELATLFEAETPGLWHRHVLNVIFDPSVNNGAGVKLSPPRQALVWAALDVAISSALAAAWHYKWIASDKKTVDFRRRPIEYLSDFNTNNPQNPLEFTVLYDLIVERNAAGKIVRSRPKTIPPQHRRALQGIRHTRRVIAPIRLLPVRCWDACSLATKIRDRR